MKGNKKTVFFSDVPGSIWIEIQSKITERYSDEVRNYYTKFGEAYLRKNRLDDGGFYSFSACMKRLGLVIIDFTSGSYRCEVEKDESGFVTITEDGELLDVIFVDLHYDFLRDLFKMIDFLASKPNSLANTMMIASCRSISNVSISASIQDYLQPLTHNPFKAF